MYNLAERVNRKVWEVYCVDCLKSIGTMTGDTLQAAIRANQDKGGIKCPECRSGSCVDCGDVLVQSVKDVGYLVCPNCTPEGQTPCLVIQN